MARSFLLSALVTRVRQLTDTENGAPADTEIKQYISTMFAKLHDIHVDSGHMYFKSTQSIAADGTADYALPTDFRAALRVDYQNATNDWTALEEIMSPEENAAQKSGYSRSMYYYIAGGYTYLYPIPPSGQTYRLVYTAQPTDLSASADATSVDVISPAGEDFIVWGAAVYLKHKEESDTTVAERNRDRAEENLREAAVMMALNNPRRHQLGGLVVGLEGDWPYRGGW